MRLPVWWLIPGVVVVVAVVLAIVATNTTSDSSPAHPGPTRSVAPPPTLSADPIPNRPPVSSTSLSAPSSTVSSTAPSTAPSTPVESAPVASSTHVDVPVGNLPEGQVTHEEVRGLGRVSIYKIAPGDTLWSIGHTFGLDGEVLTLYQWNRSVIGQDPDLIHPGTVVIVDPSGKVSTA